MGKLISVKELMQDAKKRDRAVVAFNVNNMELIQAITETANEMGIGIILQVSNGARKYASMPYLMGLVKSAVESVDIPIALHLDHGDSFDLCKMCIDAGFTSVMIDGSHLPLDENIALTKQVVEYAKPKGVSVEGELGEISGIEDDVNKSKSYYTDPEEAKRFVKETGVDSLAVSIGTAHGAFKYKEKNPTLRFDILKQIQSAIPNTPLVLHGASSVTQSDVEIINQFGGEIKNANGIDESELAKAIPLGVRKINIDSDLRLAFTAAIRKCFNENPNHFDPRQYLKPARDAVRGVVRRKLEHFSK